jgi:hypothetical protein
MMHPFLGLMRRYVVDYLQCQNPEVCAQIMSPDYVLHMGDTKLGPRDAVYVPAVVRQLQQFPGLGMTVNEIVFTEDRLAMRFTQHGASVRHDGRRASWGGIGLYQWNGHQLTSNYAIEDYYSRRVQLAGGPTELVESPAVAPWDEAPAVEDSSAVEDISDWIQGRTPLTAERSVMFDNEPAGNASALIDVQSTRVDELFSAGPAVGFHITQHGLYRGGLEVPDNVLGHEAVLFSVGLVRRLADGTIAGRVIRERVGLQRSLTA